MLHSQMLPEEKVREQAHIPAWCSTCRALLWCMDQAVSILHLQLPGVSVLCFLFPRAPQVRKRICVASYRFRCYSWILYFSKSQKRKVNDFLLPEHGWDARQKYISKCCQKFISLAGSIDNENHILLQLLYFPLLND